jgi:hypothetical protein
VLECRKLYAQSLTGENFIDVHLRDSIYPTQDYHRMYVGEIVRCLTR